MHGSAPAIGTQALTPETTVELSGGRMAAAKKKIPKSKLQPPADPDIWPDIDVLTDEQIARAKRCWDAFDATKIDEVAAADLGGMLRALGYTPTQVRTLRGTRQPIAPFF